MDDGVLRVGEMRVPFPVSEDWSFAESREGAGRRGVEGASRIHWHDTGNGGDQVVWTWIADPSVPLVNPPGHLHRYLGGGTPTRSVRVCSSEVVVSLRQEYPDISVVVAHDDLEVGVLWVSLAYRLGEAPDRSFRAFGERVIPIVASAVVGAELGDGSRFMPCDDPDAARIQVEQFLGEWLDEFGDGWPDADRADPPVVGGSVDAAVAVRVSLPVYDEEVEDGVVPGDLPLVVGERSPRSWVASIDLATGAVDGWPDGRDELVQLWVKDGGVYELLDADGQVIVRLEDVYVPRSLFVASDDLFGDGIRLAIGADGRVLGWPATVDLSDFDDVDG